MINTCTHIPRKPPLRMGRSVRILVLNQAQNPHRQAEMNRTRPSQLAAATERKMAKPLMFSIGFHLAGGDGTVRWDFTDSN